MTGMTGDVPYYGGRFTPAQAYAASRPRPAAAPPPPPPPPAPTSPSRAAARSAAARAGAGEPPDALEALAHLRDSGVLSDEEYDELRARVRR